MEFQTIVGPVLGGDPNEYIAKSVRQAELLLLLTFINFHDFGDDKSVDIEISWGMIQMEIVLQKQTCSNL